jgi:hypothetical protein
LVAVLVHADRLREVGGKCTFLIKILNNW